MVKTDRLSPKKKKIAPGPRTRSRANDANLCEKDPLHATRKKASKKVPAKEGVESSTAPKLLNPTCSKLLKQCGDIQSGSIAAYVALRERQKQNLELDPRIEDAGESSLPNEVEEGEPAPKRFRGRSKMYKVHGRTANEKVVITLNKQNQPIGDKKVTSELSNFLGTLVKDHVSITHVNWHVVPEDLKQKMVDYTLERYDIPDGGLKWINKTLNTCWRVHKSRVKKEHYTKYDTDEQRLENRPLEIPLEDFKLLLKYWADEGVQKLARDNTSHRNSYADPHTLGRTPLVQVRQNLKNTDPNLQSPSNAKVYFRSRKRNPKVTYKSNTEVIQKRLDSIDEVLKKGNDANELLPSGEHGAEWLVGRKGDMPSSENNPTTPQPSVADLKQITQELEAKFNRKLQGNMAWMLKKLAEANPGMKIDIGDFCAAESSDHDENGTPFGSGTQVTPLASGTQATPFPSGTQGEGSERNTI
ncbi:uncharacterized protein LOC108217084 [Daucus carota subsp. sativus]|uniref:uncharacterized protein LOC108217084 n=1 Tax=Daucus carota subsp. sativus TaxID=79200 RepID=UPI00308274B8